MSGIDQNVKRDFTASGVLKAISDTGFIFYAFVFLLIVFYAITPLFLSFYVEDTDAHRQLAILTMVCAASLLAGYSLPFSDKFILPDARFKVRINSTLFHWFVWGSFVLYAVVVLATAPSIPIISAFAGATRDQLSVERGEFLKLREGFEVSFRYLDTFYTGFLLPYSLALMVVERRRAWPLALGIFLPYTISSMQKALFIRALAPLAYLAAQRKLARPMLFLAMLAILSVGILTMMVALERNVPPELVARSTETGTVETMHRDASSLTPAAHSTETVTVETEKIVETAEVPWSLNSYFGPHYVTRGVLDQIIWRTLAVPVFTAADAMVVIDKRLNGQLLWGATSTPIAFLTGQERVNLDRMVFAEQWGDSDIGRANSVYFTELLANFGWIGAALGSLLIGISFRWFSVSRDYAFKSMILLYVNQLAAAGIIGTLLSNGFIALFFMAIFVEIKRPEKAE